MERLPLEAQTAYAELLESLLALEAARSVGHLNGCFASKVIKGDRYVYFQHSLPGGRVRQTYVGPQSPALDRLIQRFEQERDGIRPDRERLERLAAVARAAGVATAPGAIGRVLRALADAGVFAAGSVLVGTQAFAALANVLGVRWSRLAQQTHDVDIVGRGSGERSLAVAVPDLEVDLPQALERLQMGFLPVPPLDPKRPSTSFKVRGSPLRVDVLVPARRRGEEHPMFVAALNVAAQPLPYLDYLVAGADRAAVLDGTATLVNVPAPARFAVHKLATARSRPIASQSKAAKDLLQAEAVLEVLVEDRPGDIALAFEAVPEGGKTFLGLVRAALSVLKARRPDVARKLPKLPRAG
jgi:hypothetical protein